MTSDHLPGDVLQAGGLGGQHLVTIVQGVALDSFCLGGFIALLGLG